jgi:hypothetical protein
MTAMNTTKAYVDDLVDRWHAFQAHRDDEQDEQVRRAAELEIRRHEMAIPEWRLKEA